MAEKTFMRYKSIIFQINVILLNFLQYILNPGLNVTKFVLCSLTFSPHKYLHLCPKMIMFTVYQNLLELLDI